MDKTLGTNNVDEYYAKNIEPIKNDLRMKYVKQQSLKLDILIILQTILKLFGIKRFSFLKVVI